MEYNDARSQVSFEKIFYLIKNNDSINYFKVTAN
jgi:hypothetical protein